MIASFKGFCEYNLEQIDLSYLEQPEELRPVLTQVVLQGFLCLKNK